MDLLAYEDLLTHLKDVDVVIHCAAQVSFNASDTKILNKFNVELTQNMVNVCLQSNIEKLIYISSVAAIGRSDHSSEVIHENTEWEDGILNTNYAVSKYHAELEVWRGNAEGLPVTILNPSLVLGAGNWSKGTPSIISRLAKGISMHPTGGNGIVDVRDVAKAIWLSVENKAFNKRIIISSENVDYKSFFSSITKALDVNPPKNKIPEFLVSMYGKLEGILKLIKWQYKGVSYKQLKSLQFTSRYDNSLSKDLLNLEYKSIQSSILEITNKYKQSQEQGSTFSVLEI